MKKVENNKSFWDRYAKFYDSEVLRFSRAAYTEMYRLMSEVLTNEMEVLELAAGTGLIAANIAGSVRSVTATDFSPKMIETAKKKAVPENVHFSVEDAAALSFEENSFDAVIISNALHIMPNPELVLENIKRVLRPNGLLIAPNFSHGHLKKSSWNPSVFILKIIGFETYSKWTPEEYVDFIDQNGFQVKKWSVMKAAFPLVYLEADNFGVGIREMRESDHECLPEFLYQAIFVPEETASPPRSIISEPEIFVYIKDFGKQAGDFGMVAEQNGQIIGAAWARIIPAYGHINDETPELAVSVLPEFRGQKTGTKLLKKLFDMLRKNGYRRTSLSVQKDNPAVRLYRRLGYEITGEKTDHAGHGDYIMIKELGG